MREQETRHLQEQLSALTEEKHDLNTEKGRHLQDNTEQKLMLQNMNRELQDKEKLVDTLETQSKENASLVQSQIGGLKQRVKEQEEQVTGLEAIRTKMQGKCDLMKEEIHKANTSLAKYD